MFVTLFGMATLVSPLQPENADDPMLVTLSEITTFVIDWYAEENTDDIPLAQTYCEMATSLIPLQPRNAEDPMLVTLSGIVTLVSLLQP